MPVRTVSSAGSDVVDLLPAELTVLTGMGVQGCDGDPGCLDARAKHYGVEQADRVPNPVGTDVLSDLGDRDVRGDPRGGQTRDEMQLAGEALELQLLGEPARLVLLLHSREAE